MSITYRPPGPVSKAFLLSSTFVRAMRGPIGSGKSGACCIEIFRRMCDQAPNADGIRQSRWAIIRNTYAELRDTVIKTWTNWFPEEHFGKIAMHPPPFRQMVMIRQPDGTTLEAEVLFMALDRPEDVKKLLSLELTGAWINEAREVPKAIIDAVTSRLRRFPAMKDGGPTWSGLIMDTNSPDDDHWWPIMAGEVPPPEGMTLEEQLMLVKPANWEFFVQPAAMLEERGPQGEVVGYRVNPDAENVQNLHPDYYPELITGKTRNWINVYVLNRIGADFDGRKVHPHFNREVHVTKGSIEPAKGVPIVAGIDFGLTPACIFMQLVGGQWRILREIVLENASARQLGERIIAVMAQHFPDWPLQRVLFWGDPSGDNRAQTDSTTPFQILRSMGIQARPTDTNDTEIRRASLSGPLTRMTDGQPGLLISEKDCPITVKGLDGGWHYKKIGTHFTTEPEKNRYSHPCEAAEYGLQGGGEGRRARGRDPKAGKQVNARGTWDPLKRLDQPRGRGAGRPRRHRTV